MFDRDRRAFVDGRIREPDPESALVPFAKNKIHERDRDRVVPTPARRETEDEHRRKAREEALPKADVFDRVEVAENVKADREAAGVSGLQKREFEREPLLERRSMPDPLRVVHIIAVAVMRRITVGK